MIQPQLNHYNIAPGVVAFSTTRRGGFSVGSYAEFNINGFCGDSQESIVRNRAALCRLLGIADDRLFMPHQVHLTASAAIDDAFLSLTPQQQAEKLDGIDTIMTALCGVCIGVSTADCIPVLLYDSRQSVACAVHAGWRGTVRRIAQKAVEDMTALYGSLPQDIRAQIGPGISVESFEVGDEVYQAFADADFDMPAISRREEKWHLDLPLCNRQQLLDAGVQPENVGKMDVCTYQHPDTFFSARRLGIQSGRIFTGIMIK